MKRLSGERLNDSAEPEPVEGAAAARWNTEAQRRNIRNTQEQSIVRASHNLLAEH